MKSRFAWDPLDPFDSFFHPAEAEFYGNFSSPSHAWSPPASSSVEIPSTPALTSEAAQALGSQSGSTSTVSLTSGGITINLLFDAAAMAAPASFRAGIQQAAAILTSTISDQITVNIKIDYSGTGGGAAAGPDNGLYESYSTVKADLTSHATAGDTVFNALPSGSSVQGQSNVAVWNAQLKLWGILGANDTTTDDGSATFATDINSSLLVGVALHELTHAMGRVPYGSPYSSSPDIFDLFRFTSPGTRMFSGASTASAAYFSVDGGNTKLADYGQTSDPSDFLNSGVQGYNDPFNEFYSGGTSQTLSTVDKEQLDALGFHLGSRGIVVAATASQAVQGGAAVTLLSGPPTITDTTSTTLSSATIKVAATGGSAVSGDLLYVNGVQNGSVGSGVTASWNASTDTLTLTGSATLAVYDTLLSEVSYQDTGTDSSTGSHPLRTVTWTVNDGAANLSTTSQIAIDRAPTETVANVILNANATTVAAASLLSVTDPDGDAITKYGFTDTGNGHFVLNGVVQANNQEIDVTAAQLSHLTYQSTGGTDSVQVHVNDGTLWSAWQSFTITGPAATVIESFGSTSLVEVGNNFYLNSISSGTGPELKYAGAAVVAGQFGAWTPIGVEQTGTGYEVAWKAMGADQYTVWTTDTNGNYISSNGLLTGASTTLESLETSFHQDLNGDGVIGIPTSSSTTTVIESFGSTSLVEVGNNFYLNNNSSGSGPELKYAGAAVVAGQFGAWAPIGVEQTATGYEVAWKVTGADQFVTWNTDSNGNQISSAGIFGGASNALESLETSFHQDLNGDGVIGVPPGGGPTTTVIEAFGSTSLVQVGSNFYLDSISSGTGPELKYGGAAAVAGQFGAWAPIGGEQTAGGYEVAWKVNGADQYAIWNTDSSGNQLSSNGIFTGTSSSLESLETSFHQDLNGDGVIGVLTPTAPAAQPTYFTVPGNDTFVFQPGAGAEVIVNGPSVDKIELDGFSLVSNGAQLAALLHHAQTGEPQSVFQSANGGHDTVVDLGNHDTLTLMNVHLADLHASNFIIQ